MIVSVALFEIFIPHAQSLKDKRMIVRSLREKLRHRFEISAGEVGLHDLHQRSRMAVSFVSIDDPAADGMLERVQTFRELLARTPVDELDVHEHPRVIFRVSENTWLEAIVRYLVAPREAGRVKTRLIKKLLAALNAAPEKVMFPAGAAR